MKKILFLPIFVILLTALSFSTHDAAAIANIVVAPGSAINHMCGLQCFQPSTYTTAVGSKVTFANADSVGHTFTSGTPTTPSGVFDSGLVKSGGTFSFTFTKSGIYPFFDETHPWMAGKIIILGIPQAHPNIYSPGLTIPVHVPLTKPIPSWIKNTAKFWSENQISDADFVKAIQYLADKKMITIPQTTTSITTQSTVQIPSWVKANAGVWANGKISDQEFVSSIQYLVNKGTIKFSYAPSSGGPQGGYIQFHRPPPTSPILSGDTIIITAGSGSSQSCVTNNNCYDPDGLTVSPGTIVTWTNDDTIDHTVTSGTPAGSQPGATFDSSLIAAGKSWSFTFANIGTYNYFDTVHPWMKGQITVENPVLHQQYGNMRTSLGLVPVTNYDIKDQASCQSLPSGNPVWDATNTCTVTNISLTLNSGQTLTVENGVAFVINGGTINNHGTITNYDEITTSGTITNYDDITTSGTINNFGTITNSGTITNVTGGTITNSGTINNNFGTIINSGTITNVTGGTIANNHGTITNSGTINNNFGTITNSGTITNVTGGTITNSGTINNNFGTITNSGTITNVTGGTIANNHGTITNNHGTITNFGTITNSGTINNNAGGTINNNFAINNNAGGTINNNFGGIINENSFGTITNSGTITNFGTIANNHGTITNSGTINNTGTITNSGTINNTGTITNSGTINNNAGGTINNNAGGTINNNFAINNNAGGTINNNFGGIINEYSFSTISNSGTVNEHCGSYILGNPQPVGTGTINYPCS